MSAPTSRRFGPYELISPLGAGGMGEVFRARDTRLGRYVAIKVLPPAFSIDPDRLHRFQQEAQAAAALNHPAILAIFDIGTADDDAPYIVSELLEGSTLGHCIRSARLSCAPLSTMHCRSHAAWQRRKRYRPSRSQAGEHLRRVMVTSKFRFWLG